MLTLQKINDPSPVWDLIKSRMVDDNNGLISEGELIGVFDDDKITSAFLIERWSEYCYEIHGGVHPDYWGRGAEICEFMGREIFMNTPCLKIVAIIPEFNRLMRKCVQKAGLIQEGILTKSFFKYMKLHDMYVYGITREKARKEGRLWHQ